MGDPADLEISLRWQPRAQSFDVDVRYSHPSDEGDKHRASGIRCSWTLMN